MSWLTPFRKQTGLKKRDYDVFDIENFFDNVFGSDGDFPSLYGKGNRLKVDIKENDREFIVEAEVPGVKKEDIQVELDDETLTIAIEHKEEVNEEKDNYIRRERRLGSVSRSFAVPNIVQDQVAAKFENGILRLTLPKKEDGQAKRNRIQID